MIVYGLSGPRLKGVVSEDSPYPAEPNVFSYYMRSKIEADRLALNFYRAVGLPVTVLRLGMLYGPGSDQPVDHGLVQMGRLRLIIGAGQNRLPYTYITNAVDCIMRASNSASAVGQAFNVVDNPPISVRELLEKNMRITGEKAVVISVPASILMAFAKVIESLESRKADPIPPRLSGYGIKRASRDLVYDTKKAKELLDWEPAISFDEGLKITFASRKQ